MGASAKRKKEKSKDFQKPKLKVGKTKPKAANSTDTSFRAKSIVLNQQSLSTSAPTSAFLFSHQLSLVSSKQDSQKRDAVASLTRALANHNPDEPLPQPAITIILKVRPLLVDASRSVREQTLKMLRSLPRAEVAAHVSDILIYVHIGMTHMATDIKGTSLDLLEWLLEAAGSETVGCAGGWIQTLRRFCAQLGWQQQNSSSATGNQWSSTNTAMKAGDSKLRAKQISTLATFLETGTRAPPVAEVSSHNRAAQIWPLWHMDAHTIGTKADPYGYLNLFGAPRDEESEMYDDAESRADAYLRLMHEPVMKGMREAKREGGEVGRAASALDKVLLSIDKEPE